MNRNTPANFTSLGTESSAAHTYCTFQLRSGLFGIDALAVKEIAVLPPMTPIPHAPPAVRGYVNLRGQIVLVLDLNRLLHLGDSMLAPDTRLIVFRAQSAGSCGVLVDRIGDMRILGEEQIEKQNGVSLREKNRYSVLQEELITGIGKLGDCLLNILDAGQFLPHIEEQIAEYQKKT